MASTDRFVTLASALLAVRKRDSVSFEPDGEGKVVEQGALVALRRALASCRRSCIRASAWRSLIARSSRSVLERAHQCMFGEQADQMPMSVDHDQVANAVFEHALGSLGQRPVGGDTDGRAGHDRRQSGIALALQEEANDIVLGDDAQRSAAIDNDDATAAHGGHASQCIIEAGIGRQARKGPFHQRIDCIQMHEEVGAEKFAEVGFVDDAERQAGFVGHHDAADAEAGGCAVSLAESVSGVTLGLRSSSRRPSILLLLLPANPAGA